MADEASSLLTIFGAGGFGREVAWLAKTASPQTSLVFGVDRAEYATGTVDGIGVLLLPDETRGGGFVVALGDPADRRHGVKACLAAGLVPTKLVHPNVDITGRLEVGAGTIICAGAILTTGIVLGEHVQINLACTVGHDVRIGDYATLAPGVNVSGHVEIGSGAYIGTGATIINGTASVPLTIGDGAVVAAGACVTKPVEPGALVAGVPAVRKR